MLIRWVFVVAVAVGAIACDLSGDNSAIIKTHAATRPGIAIWEAVGQADAFQAPDISYSIVGKDCSHAGFSAGRYGDLPYLKIIRADAREDDLMVSRPYTEHGYATQEEFVEALETNVELFTSCKAIVFSFMRAQAWPTSDWFEVTVDKSGRIVTVGNVTADNQ